MRSRLLRIEGFLSSNRYIREVLQPEGLPLFKATPHAIFQQDNARPNVARIMQAFFQRRWVSLLSWPARSPDMSPIEHVWDMVDRRLIHQGPPAPTLDALWIHIQTACRDIPQEDIQGLLDSMPRRIETLRAVHEVFTPYRNRMLSDHVQFCNSNRLSIPMYVICGIHLISVTYLLLGVAIFTNSSVLFSVIPTSIASCEKEFSTMNLIRNQNSQAKGYRHVGWIQQKEREGTILNHFIFAKLTST